MGGDAAARRPDYSEVPAAVTLLLETGTLLITGGSSQQAKVAAPRGEEVTLTG